MDLHAALHCLHLSSPDPEGAARFYAGVYDMGVEAVGDAFWCRAPGRQLAISRGTANQLHYAQFALADEAAWAAFLTRAESLPCQPLPLQFVGPADAVCLQDPDGHAVVFSRPMASEHVAANTPLPPVTLQHFAWRTQQLPAMLDFYTAQLGFVLSDAVRDDEGTLRACFLRSDHLHHALALFFAPVSCFDHQSYEAPDWSGMRTWGDHMATLRVPIVWGIGRHGPGNDVFFMVRDPDGNLAEISAEIEHCEPDRPAGLWAHEERTLNLWGKAILRS